MNALSIAMPAFDVEAAEQFAEILARTEKAGKKPLIPDTCIAAIAAAKKVCISAGFQEAWFAETEVPLSLRPEMRPWICMIHLPVPLVPPFLSPPLHQVSKFLVVSDLREACAVKFFIFQDFRI